MHPLRTRSGFGLDTALVLGGALVGGCDERPPSGPGVTRIELILGCKTPGGGTHRWMECLLSAAGGVDIASLDGGPGSYTIVGSGTGQTGVPRDNDMMVAELIGNTVNWYLNGVLACSCTGSATAGLGDGAGIAAFYRSGDAYPAAFDFRSLRVGPH
jgi:hypothetical protein